MYRESSVRLNSRNEVSNSYFRCISIALRRDNKSWNKEVVDNLSFFRKHDSINTRQYPERDFECNFAVATINYSGTYMMRPFINDQETDTVRHRWMNSQRFISFYILMCLKRSHQDSPSTIEIRWNIGADYVFYSKGEIRSYARRCTY
jgi:capsule polysaccharide modification protein KpsS